MGHHHQDNIRRLANYFRTPKVAEHFNMRSVIELPGGDLEDGSGRPASVIDICGATACICGHAAVFFDAPYHWSSTEALWAFAGRKLGLGREEADRLFMAWEADEDDDYDPDDFQIRSKDATPAQAARVLDHLADTGEIDWSVAFLETRA